MLAALNTLMTESPPLLAIIDIRTHVGKPLTSIYPAPPVPFVIMPSPVQNFIRGRKIARRRAPCLRFWNLKTFFEPQKVIFRKVRVGGDKSR